MKLFAITATVALGKITHLNYLEGILINDSSIIK
jgi:hypothetical protein